MAQTAQESQMGPDLVTTKSPSPTEAPKESSVTLPGTSTADTLTQATGTSTASPFADPAPAVDLVPSTRPGLQPEDRSLSQVSNITQPASTPMTDLSAATPTSTPPNALHTAQLDPKVAALQAMFPDFDPAILQSVLEASNWDNDRAIDVLLGMSDPQYKSHSSAPAQTSQEDIDEQLARRLFLEEQQAQADYERTHQAHQPPQGGMFTTQQHPIGHQRPASGSSALPGSVSDLQATFKSFISGAQAKLAGVSGAPVQGYGRGGAGSGQGPDQQPGQAGRGGPSGAEIRQQFNEYAETGKKHLTAFVTKVKAKIQEYDNPVPGQQGGQPGSANSGYYAPPPQASTQSPASAPYVRPQPQGNAGKQVNTTPSGAPSTGGYVIDPPTPSATSQPQAQSLSSQPTTGVPNPSTALNPPAMNQRSSFDQGEAKPATFDTSRLGLKPKRPVSLVGPSAESSTKGKSKAHDEDDDLEYVTSPFEDR